MAAVTDSVRVGASFWPESAEHGVQADLEATRDEYNPGVAIHTYVDCRGSVASYYLDRESAIQFAYDILGAAALRRGVV